MPGSRGSVLTTSATIKVLGPLQGSDYRVIQFDTPP
jgi:hypothetical protein